MNKHHDEAPADTGGSNVSNFDFERPHPDLMKYYTLCALATVLGFPFAILPFVFRYRTLRYRIDGDGISMQCGVFFRREVYVTYRRIQDIHVTRNLIERWMGLAKISVQTAAGSSRAELVIEGCKQPEALRDFLYARMRGTRDTDIRPTEGEPLTGAAGHPSARGTPVEDCVLHLLTDIRDALRDQVRRKGTPA
jgi:putative membrane protein